MGALVAFAGRCRCDCGCVYRPKFFSRCPRCFHHERRKPIPRIKNAWLKAFLARYPLSEYPRTGDRVIDVSGGTVSLGIDRAITQPVRLHERSSAGVAIETESVARVILNLHETVTRR